MNKIKLPGLKSPVLVEEIGYFRGDGPYSYIYLKNSDKKITLSMGLKSIHQLLPGFIRPHKSYLVNPYFIESYATNGDRRRQRKLILLDGVEIIIPRRRQEFMRDYFQPAKPKQAHGQPTDQEAKGPHPQNRG